MQKRRLNRHTVADLLEDIFTGPARPRGSVLFGKFWRKCDGPASLLYTRVALPHADHPPELSPKSRGLHLPEPSTARRLPPAHTTTMAATQLSLNTAGLAPARVTRTSAGRCVARRRSRAFEPLRVATRLFASPRTFLLGGYSQRRLHWNFDPARASRLELSIFFALGADEAAPRISPTVAP